VCSRVKIARVEIPDLERDDSHDVAERDRRRLDFDMD
jgi:hypothetical protein